MQPSSRFRPQAVTSARVRRPAWSFSGNGLNRVDEETGEKKDIPFLRYYNVFSIDQCEGLKARHVEPLPQIVNPDQQAEMIIANYLKTSGVKLGHEQGDRAFYRPSTDSITLPLLAQFHHTAEYYSTAFHEMVHSTGHKSRLDRLEKTAFFGSEAYSKEELIAEIGAAALVNHTGLETAHSFRNNAAYVQNWLQVLKNDKRFIVSAAGKADKIYNVAFYNCTALTEISLPETVSLISTTAFDGCSKLTASVIRGSYAHDWCVENKFPCMPIGDDPASPYKYRYIDANTIALTGYTGSDTKITLPEAINGRIVAAIDAGAFANAGLQEIVLHGAIETIGEKAFAGCSQLSVNCTGDGFPVMAADAFDRGTVIALAKEIPAFVCDPALDADLTGLFDEWRTEDMAWSSADASVTTVSGGVVSPVGSGEVQICAEWQNVTLKIPVNVQLISGPVLVLPKDVEIIHREAFMGTTAERIIVPEGCKTIAGRAFADSETLMLVDVPEGVQIAVDAIENSPNAHIIYRSK